MCDNFENLGISDLSITGFSKPAYFQDVENLNYTLRSNKIKPECRLFSSINE